MSTILCRKCGAILHQCRLVDCSWIFEVACDPSCEQPRVKERQRDALRDAAEKVMTEVEALDTMGLRLYNAWKSLRAALASEPSTPARQLVNEQAEDEGLRFEATTAPEAYLQQELRRLHAAVEGEPSTDRLREVLEAVRIEYGEPVLGNYDRGRKNGQLDVVQRIEAVLGETPEARCDGSGQ